MARDQFPPPPQSDGAVESGRIFRRGAPTISSAHRQRDQPLDAELDYATPPGWPPSSKPSTRGFARIPCSTTSAQHVRIPSRCCFAPSACHRTSARQIRSSLSTALLELPGASRRGLIDERPSRTCLTSWPSPAERRLAVAQRRLGDGHQAVFCRPARPRALAPSHTRSWRRSVD